MATPRDHTGPPEDAIEMLKADHQKVRNLFRDYEKAQDQKAKSKIAQQVFVELETHAQLEETVFYPAFRQEADQEGKQLVAESLHRSSGFLNDVSGVKVPNIWIYHLRTHTCLP